MIICELQTDPSYGENCANWYKFAGWFHLCNINCIPTIESWRQSSPLRLIEFHGNVYAVLISFPETRSIFYSGNISCRERNRFREIRNNMHWFYKI